MERLPKLYIVVPCYNEEEALPLTVPVFRKKLTDLSGRIAPDSRLVLVDDGSSDATWELIRSYHEQDERVSGIRLGRNRGHQNALTAGLMWSRTRCDVTVSIDADSSRFRIVYSVDSDSSTYGCISLMILYP